MEGFIDDSGGKIQHVTPEGVHAVPEQYHAAIRGEGAVPPGPTDFNTEGALRTAGVHQPQELSPGYKLADTVGKPPETWDEYEMRQSLDRVLQEHDLPARVEPEAQRPGPQMLPDQIAGEPFPDSAKPVQPPPQTIGEIPEFHQLPQEPPTR